LGRADPVGAADALAVLEATVIGDEAAVPAAAIATIESPIEERLTVLDPQG